MVVCVYVCFVSLVWCVCVCVGVWDCLFVVFVVVGYGKFPLQFLTG